MIVLAYNIVICQNTEVRGRPKSCDCRLENGISVCKTEMGTENQGENGYLMEMIKLQVMIIK